MENISSDSGGSSGDDSERFIATEFLNEVDSKMAAPGARGSALRPLSRGAALPVPASASPAAKGRKFVKARAAGGLFRDPQAFSDHSSDSDSAPAPAPAGRGRGGGARPSEADTPLKPKTVPAGRGRGGGGLGAGTMDLTDSGPESPAPLRGKAPAQERAPAGKRGLADELLAPLRVGAGAGKGGERSPGGEGVFEPDTPDSDASRSRQMAPRERRGEEPPAPPAPQAPLTVEETKALKERLKAEVAAPRTGGWGDGAPAAAPMRAPAGGARRGAATTFEYEISESEVSSRPESQADPGAPAPARAELSSDSASDYSLRAKPRAPPAGAGPPARSPAGSESSTNPWADARWGQQRGAGARPVGGKPAANRLSDSSSDEEGGRGGDRAEREPEYPERPESPGTIKPMPAAPPPPPIPEGGAPLGAARGGGRRVLDISSDSASATDGESELSARLSASAARPAPPRRPCTALPARVCGKPPQLWRSKVLVARRPRARRLRGITVGHRPGRSSSQQYVGADGRRGAPPKKAPPAVPKLFRDPLEGTAGGGGKPPGQGGAGQKRVGRDGRPLPDITPDSSVRGDSESVSSLDSAGDDLVRKPSRQPAPRPAPARQRIGRDGKPLPDITPDTTEASEASEASEAGDGSSTADSLVRKASGKGPRRIGREGKPLPDITPDTTEASEAEERSAASAPKAPGRLPGKKGLQRFGRDGKPLPDISPDTTEASEADDGSSTADSLVRNARGKGPKSFKKMDITPDTTEDERSEAAEPGPPARAPPAPPLKDMTEWPAAATAGGGRGAGEGWIPLSSRLESMDKPDFRWENFDLAGLPPAAKAMGGRKAWLRHKTEQDFRAALQNQPTDTLTMHAYALFLYNKKRDLKTAEEMFRAALRVNPEYVECLLDFGVMCWNRWRMADADRKEDNDRHKAAAMLRKAVAIVSHAGLTHPRAYSKLALWLDGMEQDPRAALAYFRLAADTCREDDAARADHEFNLAAHLEELKEYEDAAKRYVRAIRADPTHASALSNYARLLHTHVGDKEQAEKFHHRAVKAAPRDADVCLNYAVFLEEVKRNFAWAKDMYDRAVAARPADPQVYLTVAEFYLRRRRDLGKCMELHKQALRLNADYIPALLSYARFLEVERKDTKNAAAYYQRAMTAEGNRPEDEAEALGAAAQFMADKMQDFPQAEEAFRRALARGTPSAPLVAQYAAFCAAQGNKAKAEQMFAEAVKETEQNAAQQYEMRLAAATYFEEEGGDLEAASANCREAIRLNAKDVRGIAQYAGLLVRHHKDWLLADKYFRQAIKMDPHHSEATLGYAAFLMDVRQNADAAEHYYKLCVKRNPSEAAPLAAYARFLAEHRTDQPGALALYRRAAAQAADDAELHLEVADFLAEQYTTYRALRGGRYDTSASLAEEHYVLAAEAAPREPRYMTALASFLADRGRPRDARVLLQQALALAPGDAATLAAHAMVCEGKAVKDYDAAEESYLSAIRADGGNAELLYNAALFLKDKRKDLDRAEEYLQRAAEAAPLDRDINLAFGKFLIKHRKNRKLGAEYLKLAAMAGARNKAGVAGAAAEAAGSSSSEYETDSEGQESDGSEGDALMASAREGGGKRARLDKMVAQARANKAQGRRGGPERGLQGGRGGKDCAVM